MSEKAIMNYDHCLHFQVLDKRISYIDDNAAEVVADNHGNICISIKFDEQWDGCGKTARFIYNGLWKDVVLDTNGECICPSEVIKKGRFSLGVYGANLKTTTPIVITVAPSILSESEGELPDAPTPDVYQQILTITADATAAADEATQACWDAVEQVAYAVKKIDDTKKELEEGGFITGIKDKNKGIILGFWVGTTEEYEALPTKPENCYVILTDDATLRTLESSVRSLTDNLVLLEKQYKEMHKMGPEALNKVLFETNDPGKGDANKYYTVKGIDDYSVIRVIDSSNKSILLNRKSATLFEGCAITDDKDKWVYLNRYKLETGTDFIQYISHVQNNERCSVMSYWTNDNTNWSFNYGGWIIKKIIGVI